MESAKETLLTNTNGVEPISSRDNTFKKIGNQGCNQPKSSNKNTSKKAK
jgi:hypothetical protein